MFLTDAYDEIKADVTDVKDLGSGVVGGIECDYYALRDKDVDRQIWVTQGARLRRAGSHHVHRNRRCAAVQRPATQLEDRQRGSHAGLAYKPPSGAKEISIDELKKVKDMGELPSHYKLGGKRRAPPEHYARCCSWRSSPGCHRAG